MPIAPVHRLKKKEIVWLARNRCQHGHTYLEHYNCYLKEHEDDLEKIGFLDIEASNLKGNFGIILCWCIKEKDGKIHEGIITKKDLQSGDLDKRVTQKLVSTLGKFDRLITYYGTRFDIPFIRTRARFHKIEFPFYGQRFHNDMYYVVRNRFSLHSNRLDVACRTLLGKSEKTHIEPMYWIQALQGKKKALKYILDHCRKDVKDLEKLWYEVHEYAMRSDRSI